MIVIDASVVIKWVRDGEEHQESALRILNNHVDRREEIVAPDLLLYEVTNALITKVHTSWSVIHTSLDVIIQAHILRYHPGEADVLLASKLALKYKTTLYDMLYVVTAERYDTIFVTADEKFVRKTKFPHIKLLSEYA